MKAKHPGTQASTTFKLLELLHQDLIGPTKTKSLHGKRYIMVVVDDFTRYTWVILLQSKSNTPEHIEALCTGKEFENSYIESFCTRSGKS